jgi:hypothetical protein
MTRRGSGRKYHEGDDDDSKWMRGKPNERM